MHARGEQRFVAFDLFGVGVVVGARRMVRRRGPGHPRRLGDGRSLGGNRCAAVIRARGVVLALTGVFLAGPAAVFLLRAGAAAVRAGGTGARGGVRGARRSFGVHALLLRGLFVVSYHQSPPARWWHAPPTLAGIR
ncbi:hypothetical protein ACWC2M_39685, partial [Streptomyces sp. NPDC001761]